MKYLIFGPILILYIALLSTIGAVTCLWSFDFKNFSLRCRNINHKLGIGYKLTDILGLD